MISRDIFLAILDLARWAPSPDNTQPWRFEILSPDSLRIHGRGIDRQSECIYDFKGHASHIAHGALIETLEIAASGFGLSVAWQISEVNGTHVSYDVRLIESGIEKHPLFDAITVRTVQRRPLSTEPLTETARRQLDSLAGDGFQLRFFESPAERWALARLLAVNGRLRVICPEAYEIHRDVIDWGKRFSDDKIPSAAVGVDPMTAILMTWVMKSWRRVDFFNRFLGGTVMPCLQLDFLPGFFCASHVLLWRNEALESIQDFILAGRIFQRFWLTVTQLDMLMQPEMTPMIFRLYARSGIALSASPEVNAGTLEVSERLEALTGIGPTAGIGFLARVGKGRQPQSRSTRLPIERLVISSGKIA